MQRPGWTTSWRGWLNSRPRWQWGALLALLVLLGLDRAFPPPVPGRDAPNALLIVARDGTPLRAFPDRDHVWRHPVALEDVSPLYLQALVRYEDRWFRWHPGVNLLALIRAAWQWLRHGHIVSGGSTLTMQVARIIEPTPRTLAGKSKQILRALQLELHYSKDEILAIYVNYAPMGGVLEGIEAASRASRQAGPAPQPRRRGAAYRPAADALPFAAGSPAGAGAGGTRQGAAPNDWCVAGQ
jgi:penicillin-binding protein 1C